MSKQTKKTTAARRGITKDITLADIGKASPLDVARRAPYSPDQVAANEARVDRWRVHAEKCVAMLKGNAARLIATAADVADFASPVDLILDGMKTARGIVPPTGEDFMPDCNHRADEDFDAMPARTRDAHELDAVRFAVFALSDLRGFSITDDEGVELVRRYFRRGDDSLQYAVGRAVRFAIGAAGVNA